MMLPRWLTILFIVWISAAVVTAQGTTPPPPDYLVRAFPDYATTDTEIIVNLVIYNQGGAATQATTAQLLNFQTGEVLAQESIRPLGGNGDLVETSLRFPLTRFPPQAQVTVWVIAGIGDVEQENSPTSINNRSATILITIPDYNTTIAQPEAQSDSRIIDLPFGFQLDLGDSEQQVLFGSIIIAGAVILIILILILRLLFQRSPQFGNWQPPYAIMPPLDTNSIFGRRQSWQPHAQNNLLPLPCRSNVALPRKLLLGMDGYYLSGWRVKAVRLNQYDLYGRVARSQVLATSAQIKKLDRLARRSSKIKPQRLARQVRPLANQFSGKLKKRINKRSARLPIAMDIRVQGAHGEVRILFELYQCNAGYPQYLDGWEPEMSVIGKTIYDSYTYTLFGQTGGETYRQYRKRLKNDLQQALINFLMPPAVIQPATVTAAGMTPAPSANIKSDTEPGLKPPNAPYEPIPSAPDDDEEII